ncbi:MAG: iron-containing alcohol dehydrogenase, partial [Rhizobiaceae bacterium]|nr:iron-containing alcohol dehydrogenase [Rhizobiaceae bacterium]
MTTSLNNNIRVDLGPRSYDIRIGANLIDQIAEMLKEIAPGARCAIVTDTNVNEIYGANLRAQLDAAKITNTTIEMAPGEASKCIEVYAHVVDQLLAQRLERTDVLIALGGGVVGDLAGFAAASMRRGMKFLQI